MKETDNGYIDTKDNLPYLGDTEDPANMRTIQRYHAGEQRKREMAEKENDCSKISYFGDGICRDERVVERDRLYRDTNLLSKSKHRMSKLTPMEEK